MKRLLRPVLYGFLIWLFPLIVSFALFPIFQTDKTFFDSIMAVTLVGSASLFLAVMRREGPINLRTAITVGLLWMGMNLALDILIFVLSPVQMTLLDYWKDIGFTYLALPIMTILMSVQTKKSHEAR